MVHCHAMFCLNHVVPHIQSFPRYQSLDNLEPISFNSTFGRLIWFYVIFTSLSLELHPKSVQKSWLPKRAKASVTELPTGQARRCRPWDGNWRIGWKPSRETEPWVFSIAGAGWLSPTGFKGCWRTKTQNPGPKSTDLYIYIIILYIILYNYSI